jgi:hypothetical protein
MVVIPQQGQTLQQVEQTSVDGFLGEGVDGAGTVVASREEVGDGLEVGDVEEEVALGEGVAVALLLLEDVVVDGHNAESFGSVGFGHCQFLAYKIFNTLFLFTVVNRYYA